jgi:hypothetical protein
MSFMKNVSAVYRSQTPDTQIGDALTLRTLVSAAGAHFVRLTIALMLSSVSAQAAFAEAGTAASPTSGWAIVTDFGATPNDASDDSAAFQAALNTGRPVYVPPGKFVVGGLSLRTDGLLAGAGLSVSELLCLPGADCITIMGTTDQGVYRFLVRDLALNGRGAGRTGIRLDRAHEGMIREVYVHGFRTGVSAVRAWSNGLHASMIVRNSDTNVDLGEMTNDFTIDDCQLDRATGPGARVKGNTTAIRFTSCVFQESGGEGLLIEGARAVTVTGAYFENNGGGRADSAQLRVTRANAVTILGGVFWGTTSMAAMIFEDVSGVSLSGTMVSQSGTPGVALLIRGTATDVSLSGNSFKKPVRDLSRGATR